MKGGNIIFIVGAPRSGTTWLQKILASHPFIISAQESEFFTSLVLPVLRNYDFQLRNPSDRGGTGLPVYFEKIEIEQLIAEIFYRMISRVEGYRDDKLFVEKTPSHALVINEINRVLPESRFVHIVRNPSDVAASMMSASKTWGKVWAPNNIFSASRMWRKHVVNARLSLNNIENNRKITIRFEDLRLNPMNTIAKLDEHFSLPIQSSELEDMIIFSNEYKLKVFGEFGGVQGSDEKEPEGFARRGDSINNRKRELLFIEKVLLQIYLRNEIKYYGY